jgi:hypothetical protein
VVSAHRQRQALQAALIHDCAGAVMNGGKVSARITSRKNMTEDDSDSPRWLGPYANVSTNMEAAYTHPNRRKKSLNSSNLPVLESDTTKLKVLRLIIWDGLW